MIIIIMRLVNKQSCRVFFDDVVNKQSCRVFFDDVVNKQSCRVFFDNANGLCDFCLFALQLENILLIFPLLRLIYYIFHFTFIFPANPYDGVLWLLYSWKTFKKRRKILYLNFVILIIERKQKFKVYLARQTILTINKK